MKQLFTFQPTSRAWHLPVIIGLCVGIPLIIGYFLGNTDNAKLTALASLSILYIQSNQMAQRMLLLMTACFGILLSFTLGLFFSNFTQFAPLVIAIYATGVHYSIYRLGLTRPPGNFFFIMLASIAITTPTPFNEIPEKLGFIAIGLVVTCIMAFFYSLLTLPKNGKEEIYTPSKPAHINTVESIIFGLFIGLSLFVGIFLKLDNPYWLPISCMAVMQGISTQHIFIRGIQRIIGTLLGLGLTWLIISFHPSELAVLICIMILQIIIETLIVRNYAVTVIFITALTVFLAESGPDLIQQQDSLIQTRFIDICIGSLIGIIGGYFLYNQKVHKHTISNLDKAKRLIKK